MAQQHAILDCSALDHELQKIADADSRPGTPLAQLWPRPVDEPKRCSEMAESEDEDEDEDAGNELVHDAAGNLVGFYLLGEWHPLLSHADMADRAVAMLRANWSLQAFQYGCYDDFDPCLLPARCSVG